MPPAVPPRNAAKPRVLRSVLLTAGGAGAGADAILVDSREDAAGVRHGGAGLIFARVCADEATVDRELDAVMPGSPDGIAVAGFGNGGALALLGARIAAREAIGGLPDGSTAIVAIVTTGADLMRLADLRGATPRLAALGWDAESLAADLGAADAWENGALIEPLAVARGLCLAAAAAAGVPAIDSAMPAGTANTDFIAQAQSSRRHGFRGKFARTAEEVRILNEIFSGQPPLPGSKP